MLTRGKTSKFRAVKYLVLVMALLAILTMGFASCGDKTGDDTPAPAPVEPKVTGVEYVANSLTTAVQNEGSVFDFAGAKLTVTYDDSTTKTINVTTGMVGQKTLTIADTMVPVTYEGFKVYIPVSVVNPTKDAAIAGLKTDTVAAANATDAGVQALISTYTKLIESAETADVAALVTEYAAAVKAYVDAKTAALAEIESYSLVGLYDQYLEKAASAKATALASCKSATTAEGCRGFVDAYKTAIAKLFADQEFYEGNDENEGQIEDKITILYRIEAYMSNVLAVKDAVLAAQSDPDKIAEYTEKYDQIHAKLDYYHKYVNLAIDLHALVKTVDDFYAGVMSTPVDDIYDFLCDVKTNVNITYKTDPNTGKQLIDTVTISSESDVLGDDSERFGTGVVVIPGLYTVADDGSVSLADSAIKAYLEAITAAYNDACTEFTATVVDAWMAVYQPIGATNEIDLQAEWNAVVDKYDAVMLAQDEAKIVIDAIDAIQITDDTKTDDEKKEDIKAAWAALKAWDLNHAVFSAITEITADASYVLGYEKMFAGTYLLAIAEDGTCGSTWTEYAYDKDFIVSYYIPNLDDLLNASIISDIEDIKNAIDAIPEKIIYALDTEFLADGVTPADSSAAIDNARTVLDDFINNKMSKYDPALVEKYFVKNAEGKYELEAQIEAAETVYDERVAAADKLIADITALPEADKITIGDYETTVDGTVTNGALKLAYNDLLAFVDANSGYYGVITNKDKLIACIDKYIDLAWEDQKSVQGKIIISGELLECLAQTNPETDTAIRTKLSSIEESKRAELSAETYENSAVNELELIEDFEVALGGLKTKATTLAAEITAAFDEWKN